MKGIVLIRGLLHLYTILFFCDLLGFEKSIGVLPCIIYLGASEGVLVGLCLYFHVSSAEHLYK
jgi:hypothetical protein